MTEQQRDEARLAHIESLRADLLEARQERDEWIAKCAEVCETKDSLLYQRDELQERMKETQAYADEGWTWLNEALESLGIESVFEIPTWKARKAPRPGLQESLAENGTDV